MHLQRKDWYSYAQLPQAYACPKILRYLCAPTPLCACESAASLLHVDFVLGIQQKCESALASCIVPLCADGKTTAELCLLNLKACPAGIGRHGWSSLCW